MNVAPFSNHERVGNQFLLNFTYDNAISTATVQEVDMCGWTLFECFLTADTIIYMGRDNDSDLLEWIDMDDEHLTDYAISIANALTAKLHRKIA